MPQVTEIGVCPPHHWVITSVRVDGLSLFHHRCVKCMAEKDLPVTASSVNPWSSHHFRPKK